MGKGVSAEQIDKYLPGNVASKGSRRGSDEESANSVAVKMQIMDAE